MTYPSGRVISHSLDKKKLKLLQILSENFQFFTIKDEQEEINRGKFHQK